MDYPFNKYASGCVNASTEAFANCRPEEGASPPRRVGLIRRHRRIKRGVMDYPFNQQLTVRDDPPDPPDAPI
jgi:hypothetical protein